MKISLCITALTAGLALTACDRNAGGTADKRYDSSGSGSSRADYGRTNAPVKGYDSSQSDPYRDPYRVTNAPDASGAAADKHYDSTGAGSSRSRIEVATNAPDNSAVNKRDRDESAVTPFDQSNTPADRETTRKVRQALNADNQLSVAAKNIKIITGNNKVTLRGPVASEQEKAQIESLVRQSGVTIVDNQLEVKQTNQ